MARRRRRVRLREPEPRVQGRQQVDECERVQDDDEQRQQREREQRDAVARERLVGRRAARRYEALAPDEPGEGEQGADERDANRGWVEPRSPGRERPPRLAVGEEADARGEEHDDARVGPEREARAQVGERAPEADPAPAQPREEVDDADRERHERRDQDEAERPAEHGAAAEVEVRRRSLGQLEARVERAEQPLDGAADLAEPLHVDGRVLEARRLLVGERRDRERRDVVGEQRPLLAERVREAEVEQLPQERRPLRLATRLLEDPHRRGSHQRRVSHPRRVAVEHEPRAPVAADAVEDDDGHRLARERRALREARRAERPERAAVGRNEDERVLRPRPDARRTGDGSVGACELDQGRGAGRVVVRAGNDARVVAVRDEDDRPPGRPGCDGDDVPQLDAPLSGEARAEAVDARVEAVEAQLLGEPLRGAERVRRAGRPIREAAGEVLGERRRRRPVERRRQHRRGQRLRAADEQRREEERQRDEEPGAADGARVDRAVGLRAPRAAPAWRARSGGRRRGAGRRHGARSVRRRPARTMRGMADTSTILLVDDEDAVQKLLRYPLEREGFRVVEARDGEEALRRFEEEAVDLVVLDLMLPRL
ncbi:MAG TPA: response regulator, partial [Gaiellaceae bacterium]|nr:response regulator [Gaiellaceae bacterium]